MMGEREATKRVPTNQTSVVVVELAEAMRQLEPMLPIIQVELVPEQEEVEVTVVQETLQELRDQLLEAAVVEAEEVTALQLPVEVVEMQ